MATTKKTQELYIGKKLHASNFDELMDQVGLDGKFQRRFNLLYNLVYVVLVAMPYMNLVLVLAVPDHWCHLPGRGQTNMSLAQWKEITLPRMEGGTDPVDGYSKCQMFDIPTPVNISDMWGHRDLEVVGCRHGWEYDQTWYATTATSQENWVCDRQLNVAHSFVFSRVGDMVGTFLFGNLGDVIGRRPVFFLSTLIIVVGRCMSIFTSWSYPLFLATIVFGTSTASTVFSPPAIVGMEISSSKKRAHIAMTQCVGLTLGACFAPLIAWATRDWVTYLLLTSLPCAIFFLTPKMFIESPRWLAAKGRNKESAKVICYIGRVNGKPMQENLVEDNLNMFTEKQEKTYGVASLASSWRLARNTVLIIICWSISSLTVFTLMLNVVNMSGNPFLNYVWQSASELPGYVVGRWISDRFGRRWPPAISFMIATGGFFLMAATTRDPSLQWVTFLTLAVTKMCITVPYYVVFLQAMETYPTSVRQTGTSLGSLASSGIGMLGPYIVYLGSAVDTRYPYIIIGLLTTLAAISATFLPETLNQKLPENLTDAQNFGKDQKFWSLTPVPSSASIAKQSYALVPKDGDTDRNNR